jgi:hypothetical protein
MDGVVFLFQYQLHGVAFGFCALSLGVICLKMMTPKKKIKTGGILELFDH